MPVYMDLVIILNFLVDFLLILGANRLCGHPPSVWKAVLAAAFGGLYCGVCLLPDFAFFGNIFWRIVSLALMSILAYGVSISAIRRGVVFAFLSMALGGLALGIGSGGFWGVVLPAACLFLLCRVGLPGRIGGRKLITVEMEQLKFTALQDTGNTLNDPLTGKPVLVVAVEIAEKLTGLSREQLNSPVESVDVLPGLRLIPYRAVGVDSSFLLAKNFTNVRIGTKHGSSLVAFAPQSLSADGEYQALTGGVL